MQRSSSPVVEAFNLGPCIFGIAAAPDSSELHEFCELPLFLPFSTGAVGLKIPLQWDADK